MKKLCLLFCVACCFWGLTSTIEADCGKVPVIPYYWEESLPEPRPPYQESAIERTSSQEEYIVPDYGQDEEKKRTQEEAYKQADEPAVNEEDDGSVSPPEPNGSVASFGDGRTFYEGEQNVVIAWNGKADSSGEEVLILTTNERSAKGMPIAALSILPLPGRPISISKANASVFVKSKILFDKKVVEQKGRMGDAGSFDVIMKKKIGSHDIFVWRMDDIDEFENDINRYVAKTYNQKAKALLTDKAFDVIRKYHERGFRYFAFDLTLISEKTRTKEAIAYRFKSKFVYFPLEISKVGGTGRTSVDLVVMTPGAIRLTGVIDENTDGFYAIGNTSVKFSRNEVRDLDPSLSAVFDSDQSSVTVRNFVVTGQINRFDGDFTASAF